MAVLRGIAFLVASVLALQGETLWNDMRSVEIEVTDFQPGEQARLG